MELMFILFNLFYEVSPKLSIFLSISGFFKVQVLDVLFLSFNPVHDDAHFQTVAFGYKRLYN